MGTYSRLISVNIPKAGTKWTHVCILHDRSVVLPTSVDLTVAREGGVWDFAVDGVILPGDTGHGLLQHGDVGIVGAAKAAGVVGASVAVHAVLRDGTTAAADVIDSIGRLCACADGDKNAVVFRRNVMNTECVNS